MGHKKRKHSSSDSSDSSSSTSEEESKRKKHSKKHKKSKKREERSPSNELSSTAKRHKKAKKLKKKLEKKKAKLKSKKDKVKKVKESCDVDETLINKSKAMAPMTKEEWEKKQSVVKRVYDETTGRHRLIKGDGEVIEEIVSRDRHKAINQLATKGDGTYFQTQMSSYIKK